MTSRDKWGAVILVILFIALGVALYFTIAPPAGPARSFEDSLFVRQRIINLQKSK
jgi:hypothetical protein